MKLNKLTSEEIAVIIKKGTEPPYSGEYTDFFSPGYYVCRQCGAVLFRDSDKFHSGCGWPAFDDEVPSAIKRERDADGRRVEILCARCYGHLGHVFSGENFTDKNLRHCVNSISMQFVPWEESRLETIYVAGGCFWCIENELKKQPGVVRTTCGYMGGTTNNPTYKEVCSGETGHAETVAVEFDPLATTSEDILKYFFKIHDSTQLNRQGPDIGTQYRSAIFYTSEEQQQSAKRIIEELKQKGQKPTTELKKAEQFFHAEDYHQNYYQKKKRFAR